MNKENLSRIGQILTEVHFTTALRFNGDLAEKYSKSFVDNLDSYFDLFHYERNDGAWYDRYIDERVVAAGIPTIAPQEKVLHDGRKIVTNTAGCCIEMSLVNRHHAEKSDTPRDLLLSVLKRTSGEKWTIPSWDLDEDLKEVRWANFTSTTGITRPMAIHPHFDEISRAIENKHRWSDCDALPQLWHQTEDRFGKRNIYMEIGANIGSCTMEMLLSTDAPILAFEPHPKNQLCLRKTISRLEPEYQNRIILVPIALGEALGSSTIYSASNNMGNSVVGKIIKDYDAQKFDEKSQFDIP